MNEVTRDALMELTRAQFVPLDEAHERIRLISEEHGMPQVHIRPEEGYLLHLLLRMIGARRVVEIGTLAGYSGTWIARALPSDGHLITLELSPDHAEVARAMFVQTGVADRVEVRVGRALDLLPNLPVNDPYDAVFMDADRPNYPAFLGWALEHVRPGGLILAHNGFMRGRILDKTEHHSPGVAGLLAFRERLSTDPHLQSTIIPIGDGLAVGLRI